MHHNTRVDINLRAYRHNLQTLTSFLAPGCRLCAVLKADAYGHGLKQLAPIADASCVEAIAIVDNWEAETIRQMGIKRIIIRLRPAVLDEISEALPWGVEEIVGSIDQAEALSTIGQKNNQHIPVHLALDVGISRMEFSNPIQPDDLKRLAALPGIVIKGVMAHFPCADEDDISISKSQGDQFVQEYKNMAPYLPDDVSIHIANSAATMRLPESHHDLARLGIITYGLSPTNEINFDNRFKPVMTVTSRVVQVRQVPKRSTIGYGMTHRVDSDAYIATLPVGYADGYRREFSNKADVLIGGERCPVVGKVSMNMITVDVSRLKHVQAGDEAVLLGEQGTEVITAEELAHHANTINYEITCLLGRINRQWRCTIV